MKVLLAPLFFQKRMCKHCANNFRRENPDKWLGIWEFESLPPLGSFDPAVGYIPDYPILSMFEEFVIDGEAYERITHDEPPAWLGAWPEVVRMLTAEGALELADVQSAGAIDSHRRGWALRRDMAQPGRWTGAKRFYDSLLASAEASLGLDPALAEPVSWDYDPTKNRTISGPDGQRHIPSAVLGMGAHLPSDDPHAELYKPVLEEVASDLREVNAALQACAELGVAPLMWAPYRGYLGEKVGTEAASALADSDAVARFFEVAFPRYTPSGPEGLATLRDDRRVKSLRDEVRRAAASGDVIDPCYPQRVFEEVLRFERAKGKKRRIAGWIASAAGTIVPGLSLAGPVAEGVMSASERRANRDWHWFYLISDGAGRT